MISSLIDVLIGKFIDLFWNRISDKISNRYTPKLWEQIFIKAAENSTHISDGIAKKLSQSRTLRRYYYMTFDPAKCFPKVKDFAVSIAVESFDEEYNLPAQEITQYAQAVHSLWIKRLTSNETLMSMFSRSGKQIQSYINEKCNIKELDNLLKDKTDTRIDYFKSYSVEDGTDTIEVFIPNKEEWVPYNDKSFCIEINGNNLLGMELGFFRVGYDYAIIRKNQKKFLKFAYYSPGNDREAARFNNFEFGVLTDAIIWLK